jgi:ribosomal-protein-alanine N-acetyltransferase
MMAGDVAPLLGVFADPVVMASFGVNPFARPQMEHWVARNLEHQDRHGYGLYSVIRQSDGLLIGDCGLEVQDDGSGDVELGYDLRSDCWGQGYATETALAVRDRAFGPLALPRLISLIRQGNDRSRRVAEKIGMQHEADLVRYGTPCWRYAISAGQVRRRG